MRGVRVEDRDDAEADGVVGNGEQEQEVDGRMARTEHEAGDEPCERDVGCGGHAPPSIDSRWIARRKHAAWCECCADPREGLGRCVRDDGSRFDEQDREDHVDDDRAGYSAQRTQDGVDGLARRVQCAAWKHRLGDLLRCDAEEQQHEDVVDQEVQGQVVAEEREHLDGAVLSLDVFGSGRVGVSRFAVHDIGVRVVAFVVQLLAEEVLAVAAQAVQRAELDDLVVRAVVDVGKDHRDHHTGDERYRKLLQEIHEPFLGIPHGAS